MVYTFFNPTYRETHIFRAAYAKYEPRLAQVVADDCLYSPLYRRPSPLLYRRGTYSDVTHSQWFPEIAVV